MADRTSIRELAAHELDFVTGAGMLVASFDDGNWCGTPVPGRPPIPPKHDLVLQLTLPTLSVPALPKSVLAG
jgi:hypothetical protein